MRQVSERTTDAAVPRREVDSRGIKRISESTPRHAEATALDGTHGALEPPNHTHGEHHRNARPNDHRTEQTAPDHTHEPHDTLDPADHTQSEHRQNTKLSNHHTESAALAGTHETRDTPEPTHSETHQNARPNEHHTEPAAPDRTNETRGTVVPPNHAHGHSTRSSKHRTESAAPEGIHETHGTLEGHDRNGSGQGRHAGSSEHRTEAEGWQAIWAFDHTSIRMLLVRNISDSTELFRSDSHTAAPDLVELREQLPRLSALWDAVRHQFWTESLSPGIHPQPVPHEWAADA